MNSNSSIGIIFDVDGTLVDSYGSHLKAWQINAERYGFDFPDELFMEIFGSLNVDYLPGILGDRSTPELVDEINLAIESTYRDVITKEFPAMPGAVELVRSLHEAAEKFNLKLAVGSSAPRENVEASIRGLGIDKYLSAVVCQNDVEEVKPNPAIFLLAAERMGVPPEHCIVIEDSTFGMAAAKAAGMYCIGFQSMGHRPEEYDQADRVIYSLTELDPASIQAGVIRIGTKGTNIADIAEALHSQKPKKYNCAQAIAKTFGRDDLIESLASCGSGQAPKGLCGALHAALLILPDEKRDAMKQRFVETAGDARCRAIRQAGQVSCTECVRVAAEALEQERIKN